MQYFAASIKDDDDDDYATPIMFEIIFPKIVDLLWCK